LAERNPWVFPFEENECKGTRRIQSMSPPKEHPLIAFTRTSEVICKHMSEASSAVSVKHIRRGLCVRSRNTVRLPFAVFGALGALLL
jgi:hypothetical protein